MANIIGTDGNDMLFGFPEDDFIEGLGGNDTIIGGLGNDKITGGEGEDIIRYAVGDGSDQIDAGAGDDLLVVTGSTEDDVISFSSSLSFSELGELFQSLGAIARAQQTYYLENSVFSDGVGETVPDDVNPFIQELGLGLNLVNPLNDLSSLLFVNSLEEVTRELTAQEIETFGFIGFADGDEFGLRPVGYDLVVRLIVVEEAGDSFTLASLTSLDTPVADIVQGTAERIDEVTDIQLENGESALAYTLTVNGIASEVKGVESFDLMGGLGNDKITGGEGEDIIKGLAGKDWITGGGGNDIIVGGRGYDILTGGLGSDTFKYRLFHRVDRITDFEPNTDFDPNMDMDLIDFSHIFDLPRYGSETPFDDYVRLSQQGADTVVKIDLNGDLGRRDRFRPLVVLEDVMVDDLNEENFLL